MTVSCRDTDAIPKVANAGAVLNRDGVQVQVMHEGTLVRAGGYFGQWMQEIITKLRGHHEPQEELIFHHLVRAARPDSLIVELGAFWAYYTNWYLGVVPGSRAVCVEPDPEHRACGEFNLALNGRSARWISAYMGANASQEIEAGQSAIDQPAMIPCHNMESLINTVGEQTIEMLHIDVQGAEYPLLSSMANAVQAGRIRFILISTHHVSISRSESTHYDCLHLLREMGAVILCEHTVQESYSGDGFIAASFLPDDSGLILPEISRNRWGTNIFAPTPNRTSSLQVVPTEYGQMLVDGRDRFISQANRLKGHGDEPKIAEVTRFLAAKYQFRPKVFLDLGANIGTHLIGALAEGMFSRGYGVEMEPNTFMLLQCNLILNELSERTQVFNVALSNQANTATMELSPTNFGDHRIRPASTGVNGVDDENSGTTRQVRTRTLDELVATEKIPITNETLIWLDTQGHEGQILDGAQTLFESSTRPYLTLEFWPYGLERTGGKAHLFHFLTRVKAIYDIGVENWVNRPPITLEYLEHEYDRHLAATGLAHHSHTDLLCVF